ncbi:PQQ-dependent dehydrogenase, methanol/ethanol family [Oceanicoccus sp. KOV_DT_Chl]|uniref:PQQ-dependent dehydrogenase, methanol/ethanol family n=1 Tax=Oceanicoccus sp. KOV_DT_Chl TaxID=1904639 RepID=UPI000C7AD226|nr:PQQ-dependent dehydrogenase, methanol/ethanol family [Oceanicoccus sp. KOV_DT_Chl]
MLLKINLLAVLAFVSSLVLAVPVTDQRLDNASAEAESANWLSHGRSYREMRYSPLQKINRSNVDQLGLGWFFETDDASGLQATPIVADGVMYFSAAWNVVYALDAKSGEMLWKYDPHVPRETSFKYCCGVVNRGVAIWQDKIFMGTLDGRLIAINADSGLLEWQVQTTDPAKPYSITGAPRIVNGKVVIGNGGSEYGVRGYVTAYSAETGEQVWRFYTIPGNPADGFENEQMALAAKTWTGEWWKMGGGGTVWDSIAFDPELNLLYLGVGNGAPHNQQIRSPGGGDNLFLTSIVALNPDTGEYVWHYQQVNGESWDYTATQQMVLLDIDWHGQPRKVIMQAPKAGFFYIIDRITGELLSAEPYVKVSWASEYNMETGRPIENIEARYLDGEKVLVFPTGLGGHNWHSMSYSLQTGLMYIPAMDFGTEFQTEKDFVYSPRHWNVGYSTAGPPGAHLLNQALIKNVPKGFLLAWDPIKQQEAWRVPYPTLGNGGTLATAGQLVFQGNNEGQFFAYDAVNGEQLWSAPVQNGIMAAPVAYSVDGEQYVSVLVGRGGGLSMILGIEHDVANINGRVVTYKLGGEKKLPAIAKPQPVPEPPAKMPVSEQQLQQGMALYNKYCARCHGVNAVSDGSVPDLRYLPAVWHQNFNQVVLHGMMEKAGMPRFDDVLNDETVEYVHAYLIARAHEQKELREQSGWWVELQSWVYTKFAQLLALLMAEA